MRGFTIACILETNSSSSTTKNFKRKNSDDDEEDGHERHPNKRQTIEGRKKYLFPFLKISFSISCSKNTPSIETERERIRLNQDNLFLLFGRENRMNALSITSLRNEEERISSMKEKNEKTQLICLLFF